MLRKFAALAVTLGTLAGLAIAADEEDSPTAKLMEQIQNKTNAMRKSTRTASEFKKSAATIPKNAGDVIKLSKEAREIKDSAEKEKKPLAEWQKLMDAMIKSTEDLSKIASSPKTTQAQAKEAFTAYTKTCAACHAVFKKDE